MNTPLFMGRSLYARFLHLQIGGPGHVTTLARARGGKGASVIIPNLLVWPGSAVVIDVKGTNAATTARRRREMGQQVYIVDPFLVLGKESDGFNPLADIDINAREVHEDIGLIADALVVRSPPPTDPHWDETSMKLLKGMTAHGCSTVDDATLPMVRRMLGLQGAEWTELWEQMAGNDAASLAREAAAHMARSIGTDEMAAVLSTMDRHTHWLSSPSIADVLNKSTFSFAELKQRPTTIYLVLPPHYLDEHSRFLRLFINLAVRQMSKGGKSPIPVLMVLDEFLSLGYMAEIERAFTLLASYNLVLWPFVQDLGRLRDLYKNSVNSLLGNSRAVQVFGVDDPETLAFVSERLGLRTVRHGRADGRIAPLRSPDEVARELDVDHRYQYVLRSGKPALVLERVNYYEDQHWKGSLGLPASVMRRLYPFWKMYDDDPDYKQPRGA
jgi:type IV secretion system protein VirD4